MAGGRKLHHDRSCGVKSSEPCTCTPIPRLNLMPCERCGGDGKYHPPTTGQRTNSMICSACGGKGERPCLCAHDGVLCPIHDAELCRHSGGLADCGPMCLPLFGDAYEREGIEDAMQHHNEQIDPRGL